MWIFSARPYRPIPWRGYVFSQRHGVLGSNGENPRTNPRTAGELPYSRPGEVGHGTDFMKLSHTDQFIKSFDYLATLRNLKRCGISVSENINKGPQACLFESFGFFCRTYSAREAQDLINILLHSNEDRQYSGPPLNTSFSQPSGDSKPQAPDIDSFAKTESEKNDTLERHISVYTSMLYQEASRHG